MPVSVQWVFCNVHKIVDAAAATTTAVFAVFVVAVVVLVVVVVVDNFIRHSDAKMWIFRASLVLSPFTEHISISRNMSSLIPFTVIFMVVIFFTFPKRCRKDLTSLKSEDSKVVSWICSQTLIALSRKCISADSFYRLLGVQREINFHLLQFLNETCVFQKLFYVFFSIRASVKAVKIPLFSDCKLDCCCCCYFISFFFHSTQMTLTIENLNLLPLTKMTCIKKKKNHLVNVLRIAFDFLAIFSYAYIVFVWRRNFLSNKNRREREIETKNKLNFPWITIDAIDILTKSFRKRFQQLI